MVELAAEVLAGRCESDKTWLDYTSNGGTQSCHAPASQLHEVTRLVELAGRLPGRLQGRCCRLVQASDYSPVYGSSAMKRARLIARVTACWLTAEHPVLRRLTMRPWRLTNFFNSSTSL